MRVRTVFRSDLVQRGVPSPAGVRPQDARSELFAQVRQVPLGPSFPAQQQMPSSGTESTPLVPAHRAGWSLLPAACLLPRLGLLCYLSGLGLPCSPGSAVASSSLVRPAPSQNGDCVFLKDTTQKDARPAPSPCRHRTSVSSDCSSRALQEGESLESVWQRQ